MAFDLQTFINNITDYGVVSPNKFEVTITLPKRLQELKSNPDFSFLNQFESILPIRALNCIPPGVNLSTNETHYQGIGPRIKMPFNAVFSEFRIVMLADVESIIEQTFNLWMNLIYNFSPSGSSNASYLTTYRDIIVSPDILISKFDFTGRKILDYHLYNAIPTSFVGQSLDWSATNSTSKFSSSFHFTTYSIDVYKKVE